MKKVFSWILLMFLLASSAQAAVYYDIDDLLRKDSVAMGISYAEINSHPYSRIYISPDFELSGFELGLDINAYIPLGDNKTKESINSVVLRHIGYNYKDKYGFRWGRLSNITLGQGLLVDAFDSGAGGSSEFTNKKAGLLAYATFYDTKLTIMNTNEKVQAARIERPITDLAGKPLFVGATYIKDDGINDDTTGTTIFRDASEAYALDLSYPIKEKAAILYTEYAEIIDQGSGISTGVRGHVFKILDYRAEFRSLNKGFSPSYFNSAYQSTSFAFPGDALQEDTNGFLASAGVEVLGGRARAAAQYETYSDINLFSAAFSWKQFLRTTGVLNITKPFSGNSTNDDRLVAVADIFTTTPGKPYDFMIRYKRVYEHDGSYEQSYSVGVQIKPFNLF